MWNCTVRQSFRAVALAGLAMSLMCAETRAQNSGATQAVHEAQGPTLGGEAPKADKSQYTLFHPTPRDLLRDINALYNGPYTVDAGHVQLEIVPVLFAYDCNAPGGAPVTTKFLSLGGSTLRLGLLNNWDIGATFAPRWELRTRNRVTGERTTQQGIGDLTLRTKLNLYGNDGGPRAFGLTGFIKLPTNQDNLGNRHVEGGMGLPVALELPKGWWLGITPEFQWFHDFYGDGHHFNFASTAFLWHSIAGNLSGYVEFYDWVSAERDVPWVGTVNVGLTYIVNKYIQLDAGAYIGVTRSANDITPFLGIAFRY
jgi:hypothetical protein